VLVTSKSNPVPGVQENVPSSRGYEGSIRIELGAKVLKMGTQLAESVGAKTILNEPTNVPLARPWPMSGTRAKTRWWCTSG
jgi:hypothetical protein